MSAQTTKPETIQLNEQAEPERRVLITTQDEDRFSLPCGEAVRACKVHMNRKVWFDELDSMLVRVGKWASDNKEIVKACYAAPREGRVVIFVLPMTPSYDRKLGALLTELDLELAQNFQVIDSAVMQVPGDPPDRLATFVNTQAAKKIHGD
jgi:hypothetical protein